MAGKIYLGDTPISTDTDLSYNSTTRLLSSSTGTDVTLPQATTTLAGLMSSSDKTKLNGIASGADVNVPTDITYDAATREVRSSTGADATLPLVASSTAGLVPAVGTPGGDRLSFWDNSASSFAYAELGPGVVMDNTTLRAEGWETLACSDEVTALVAGTARLTFRMPYAATLLAVRANVKTAPTGANLVVDINEEGSSVLSTKLSIDAGEKTSTTAATAAVISDSALADDAEITIDIDQVGSTVAGVGLKVGLYLRRV